MGLALLFLPGLCLAQDGGSELMDVGNLVMYGLEDSTHELLRYDFGTDQAQTIGQVKLSDGSVLYEVESLAHFAGQINLYAVWNFEADARSRLVEINMLTAEATLLPLETGFGNIEGLTAVSLLNRGPGPGDPTTVILLDSNGEDAFEVSFVEVTYNDDGTSSWTYHVRELATGKDLSHWNLALGDSHQVMSGTTDGYEVGIDGSTGFFGIKWDVTEGFAEGDFTIVLDKHYGGTEGGNGIGVLAKGGRLPDTSEIFGPTENVPAQNTLYGIHADSSGRMALVSIDTATGVAQQEMELLHKYEGLAAAADGTLVAVSNNQTWRIDPYSDTESLLGSSAHYDIEALEYAFGKDEAGVMVPGYDPDMTADGALFAFSDRSDQLLLIDPATGMASVYHCSHGAGNIEGIVFVTQSFDPTVHVAKVGFD
ncbi:MAG: hypothetical protein D8M59_02170 [Planctomycetes bacterium]|nr:hypothetical protein [Planctomycetota bacterium]